MKHSIFNLLYKQGVLIQSEIKQFPFPPKSAFTKSALFSAQKTTIIFTQFYFAISMQAPRCGYWEHFQICSKFADIGDKLVLY